MRIAGHLLVIGLASLFVLLAVQAEPVTATLGYVAAGLLAVSVIASSIKGK